MWKIVGKAAVFVKKQVETDVPWGGGTWGGGRTGGCVKSDHR